MTSDFNKWLDRLDEALLEDDYFHDRHTVRFRRERWRPYYEDGMTPREVCEEIKDPELTENKDKPFKTRG